MSEMKIFTHRDSKIVKAMPDKNADGRYGYLVQRPDGTSVWRSKETFDHTYREVTDAEAGFFLPDEEPERGTGTDKVDEGTDGPAKE